MKSTFNTQEELQARINRDPENPRPITDVLQQDSNDPNPIKRKKLLSTYMSDKTRFKDCLWLEVEPENPDCKYSTRVYFFCSRGA